MSADDELATEQLHKRNMWLSVAGMVGGGLLGCGALLAFSQIAAGITTVGAIAVVATGCVGAAVAGLNAMRESEALSSYDTSPATQRDSGVSSALAQGPDIKGPSKAVVQQAEQVPYAAQLARNAQPQQPQRGV